MAEATLKEIREFFHTPKHPMTLSDFRAEWQQGGLTDEDKGEIRFWVGKELGK